MSCDVCWESNRQLQPPHEGCRKLVCERCLSSWRNSSIRLTCPLRCGVKPVWSNARFTEDRQNENAPSVSWLVLAQEFKSRVRLRWSTKPCPVCRVPVMKDGGCKKVICSLVNASATVPLLIVFGLLSTAVWDGMVLFVLECASEHRQHLSRQLHLEGNYRHK